MSSGFRSRNSATTGTWNAAARLVVYACIACVVLAAPVLAVPPSPPSGPGGPGGPGGPCNPPPLPPGLLLPSHAQGQLRETCGGILRGVANKPIEVILRVKQQPMFCDPNNIPPTYSYDVSVAHGTTAADGSFNVEFFAQSANIHADSLLLELKVRIRVFADDGVTLLWETAYYGQGVGNEFFVIENIVYCLTEGTRIHVVSPTGESSFGAEVFVNGQLHPERTNPNGLVTIFPPVPVGAQIVARALVHESKSLRGAHDQASNQNWKYRAYITSLPLRYDGNGDNVRYEPTIVTDPNGAYTLNLNRDAAYIGLHLVGSIEWDASPAELTNFASKMRQAGQYVFNATDGQMLIERVDIFDDKQNWRDADFQVNADASLRAHVDSPRGGFWLPSQFPVFSSWMHMSRSNDAPVYIHEFGHYGMELGDEYKDDDDVHCATGVGGSDPQFASNGGKASCMMFNQWNFTKICSGHAANPHVTGTRQGDEDCWSEIKRHFTEEAPGPNGAPRWRMKTPVDRGVIVGALPPIPVSDWTTQVETHDANNVNLCQPVQFRWLNNGGFALGARVFSRDASGRTIFQGVTDQNGVIDPFQGGVTTMTGLHVGDKIGATWYTITGGQLRQFFKTRTYTENDCLSAMVVLLPAPGQPIPQPQDMAVESESLPFAVALQVEPTANPNEARVRVRAGEVLAQPPVVRCSIDTEDVVREVAMNLDSQSGDWIGVMSNVPEAFAVVAEVEAADTHGAKSTFVTKATMTATAPDGDSELVNSDGTIELLVPGASLPAQTKVSIGAAAAALNADLHGRLISGPVAITTAGSQLTGPATLRFALPFDTEEALRARLDPARLMVVGLDEASGRWVELNSEFRHGRLSIDCQINTIGAFALLERENVANPSNPAPANNPSDAGNPSDSNNQTDGAAGEPVTPETHAPSGNTSGGASACGVGMASVAPLMFALICTSQRLRRCRRRREHANS